MSMLIGIFKFIVAGLPFAGLLLLVRGVNLKKANRGRQFVLPGVALVYSLVFTYLLFRLGGDPFGIQDKVALLLEKIPALAGVAQAVMNFVSKYLLFITNALVVLVFLVVKAICLPIAGAIWKSRPGLMQSTSAWFYEYDEEYQRWFLQERWRDFRGLMKAFWLAATLAAMVLMALSQQFPHWAGFAASPYPCFAALMLGEIFALLGGYTRSEYEQDILGDDARSRRVVNLSKLRELLRQLFGDRLLLEGTELESLGQEGVTDLLEDLALEESPRARITAEYFQILKEGGTRLNVDDIVSAQALLEGESVLFCNPFYRDLTPYFLLPMSDTLMHRRKCLVIAGRKSTEPEIRSWMEESLREYLKMSGLWRVGSVGDQEEEFEIGILSFSQLYDLEMLSARRDFFRQVEFVLMLEPSLILATGQVGLSLVVNYCDEGERHPTYCMCDRNCDGLVDTLSHMIKQSITIVSATETPTCLHSEMCWAADGPYLHQRIMPDISRYLGLGTELAVASVKDQAPRVVWRGEKKFPVVDMKWIAGQYYQSICQYANLPMNQESVYEAIGFEADLWGTPKEKEACLIVEDEFCNLLEMVRLFLTRAEEEAFVNVISEDYLLRGYMQDNWRIFAADRKAIPTIVPDYARTERNATMRLMMMLVMSDAIPEELAEKELRLVGIKTDHICDTLNNLINKYTLETRPVVVPVVRDVITGFELESGSETMLKIRDKEEFLDHAGLSFRTAYYITEDDKENSSYMDAKLFGHIYQAVLPGQFFTYDGKYYEVRSVTPEKGVLVRRAADHIVGRRYYRQKRRYHLESRDEDSGRSRHINGLEVTICGYEISVETDGYLELDESNDLRRAREVRIADNECQGNEHFEYIRNYRHKNVLRLRLPKTTEEVRYTICLLLMEVFRTVYADAWPYLAAVTAQTDKTREALRGVLYTLDGSGSPEQGNALVEEDCIYIIEDSDVDMGLLESVDRNLTRLLSIVTDFLDWHQEKMTTPDPPEPGPGEVELPPQEKKGIFAAIKRFFGKIGGFFRRLFGRKPKQGGAEGADGPEDAGQPQDAGQPERSGEEAMTDRQRKKAQRKAERQRKKAERQAEKERRRAEKARRKGGDPEGQVPEDQAPEAGAGTGAPAAPEPPQGFAPGGDTGFANPIDETLKKPGDKTIDDTPEDSEQFNAFQDAAGAENTTPLGEDGPNPPEDIGGTDATATRHRVTNRYQRSCYLLYGYDHLDGALATGAALAFLNDLGFGDGELRRARKGQPAREVSFRAEEHCDFCGLPLSGVAYDVLGDGRVRCVSCTASAIQTVEQFRDLYRRVLPTMETFYDIKLGMPVRVRTADARVIAKHTGAVFTPTKEFDARAVGFAKHDKDGFTLYVENGAPRLAAMETIVHELTHIWQFTYWDAKRMRRTYGSNRDLVYEGMAMWASIQFLYLIGETAFARRKEENTLARNDIYGDGFRLFCQKYPLSRGTKCPEYNPFHNIPPL